MGYNATAVSTEVSCVLSLVLCLLLFSGSQTYRLWLAATPLRTIFGGFLSSLLFTFLLTFIGNIESFFLGKGSQAGLFPEVTLAFLGAISTAAMIHRVCVTTCIIFSGVSLYYMNSISQKSYTVAAPQAVPTIHKKKRAN